MKYKVNKSDCIAEIKRFYIKYYKFCKSPDPDILREVLFSAYSLNDKLRKIGYPDFFNSNEFLALKAIRNFATHQSELLNDSKSLPIVSTYPIETETSVVCLLPIERMNSIIESSNIQTKKALKKVIIFYKKYTDIYPCIFNFGVTVYFYMEKNNLNIDIKELSDMSNSIEYEKKHGYSHYINGRISLPAGGSVDEFLDKSLIDLEERAVIMKNLYTEKNGMFTLKI